MLRLKSYMMKRFLVVAFAIAGYASHAQPYTNSWIDFNKTYYKFPIGRTGLYRIPQTYLQTIGLGSMPAEQFQLWRNGQQIAIYTSKPSGPMGASDYIEFWGEMNDGKPDKRLYRDSTNQLSDKWSLESDTTTFFLTVDPSIGSNFRLVDDVNNVAGNALPPEPYFMYTLGSYFKNMINPGFAAVVGEYIYSASYDQGEGYTSGYIVPLNPLIVDHNNLYPYAAGPSSTFSISGTGDALNIRNVQVKLNNTLYIDQEVDFFNVMKNQVTIPTSILNSGSVNVNINNICTNTNDRMVFAKYELTYPHQFNFGGSSNFEFDLPSSASGNYLEVSNFNGGSATPVLYDVTNRRRYVADLSVPLLVRFALPASFQARHFVLVSEDATNITTVNSMTPRTFVNYSQVSNQGNYLIVSNSLLYSGTAGNQVEAFRQYRSSGAGGGYNAKTYDIDELIDQFGFGIKRYPESVRSFLKFARDNFSSPPLYTFLIGKGVNYSDAKSNESDPNLPLLDLVPTFGFPASDNLLSANAGETVPTIPIGRLPAINSTEIQYYLNKVKEYESAAANSPQTVAGRAWMKNIVHAIGGGDSYLQAVIFGYMNTMANIIQDTLYGGRVYNFSKNSAFIVEQITNAQLNNLFSDGIGILTYFGHSSATTLEFNLDDPTQYNNPGKYPVFFVNGCNAGDFFAFNPARFNNDETLSERYVLANQRGSIAFVASTHFGIVNYLNIYMDGAYTAISGKKYGAAIGDVMKESSKSLLDITGYNDYYGRMHAEEISLDGDPAIKIYAESKPDYVVEDPLVKVSPTLISVADTAFHLSVQVMNIGRAIRDSVILEVKRQYPNGMVVTVARKKIPGIRYADSLNMQIPINPLTDKGENKFIVTIDPDNVIDEVSESNNSTTKTFYIIEDEARPVYPYEYSIVNNANTSFYASTANPLNKARDYVMEIDTTALFNSTSKKSVTINSVGGLLEFKPGISLQDSTVYYWRTAPSATSGNTPNWNTSSFVYLPNSSAGYNQSHYFQLKDNALSGITLSDDRVFRYNEQTKNIKIATGLYPYFLNNDLYISEDETFLDYYGCRYNTLQFAVFDSITLTAWANSTQPDGFGRFGSVPRCIHDFNSFEFAYDDTSYRRKAVEFLENLPNGYYVSVTNLSTESNTVFIDQWMADTARLGPGRSLYHELKNLGLVDIDQFTKNLPFLFFFKKGDPRYPIYSYVGPEVNTHILGTFPVNARSTRGTIESPWFGPVKQWKELHWSGKDIEPAMPDSVAIQLYGKDNAGNISLLANIRPNRDTSISFIDNKTYPYLKMVMLNNDTLNGTPDQLRYWRLNADLPPEGAIAPNILFQSKDTLDVGEKLNFAIPFKNVSPFPFDSLKLKLVITDKSNVAHTISLPMAKPLVPGDTAMITYSLDTKDYTGANTLFAEFNPDNAQPEQYHFNNFLFQNIYVKPDNFNPLLDVTFDGVHILNKDIVSAQPHVVIKLKDDSRYLALDDTSLMTVQLRFPDGTLRTYGFTNDTLKFTPSGLTPGGSNNTATIDFNPRLLQDGDYELIVTGKDKSGNKAGSVEYRVTFKIINKPMISNLLNYPNPFTSSTAFVFTVTGIDVPQNIKIEIMTITGKIVREITKNELGPIHIGRNITEFKWDGTDQYGQKLGNGVYLYRVVTNLNGKSLDKYKAEGDDTDKYFNNGYGKMYLMR